MGKCWSPPQLQENHKKRRVSFSCNKQDRPLDKATVPVVARLTSYRRENPLGKIIDRLEPKRTVPVGALPQWEALPLYEKIPAVPAPQGTVTFTRGKIAKPLEVKKQPFTLRDPYNREHSVNSYDPLHDPHAEAFLNKPITRQLLIQQKLIDNNGRVLCSLKQFNRYRSYLHSVYTESLNEYIHEEDEREKQDLETEKELSSMDLKSDRTKRALLAQQRKKAAEKRRAEQWEQLSLRMEGKQNRERTILQCQMEQKIRTQVFKALISRQRMAVHQERYQALQAQQGLYHGRGLEVIAEKEIIGQRRLDENKDTKTDMQKYYIAEWLLTKWKDQERRIDREEQVREGIEYFLEDKSIERRRRLELYRKKMRLLQQKKKAEIARKEMLMRKYYYLWLERVRDIKAERAMRSDSWHLSCWETRTVLKNLVTQLRIETNRGQEKFVQLITLLIQKAHQAHDSGKQEEKEKPKMYKVEDNNEEEEGDEEVAQAVENEPVMNPDEILHTNQQQEHRESASKVEESQTLVTDGVPPARSSKYVSKKVGRYGRKRGSISQQQNRKPVANSQSRGKGIGRKQNNNGRSLSNRSPLMEKFKDK